MTDYRVTGYPLPEEGVVLEVENYDGEFLLIDEDTAGALLDAWSEAPARGSDVVRTWASTEEGRYLITALHMDGEITIDLWPDYDSGIWDLAAAPFDFEYTEVV